MHEGILGIAFHRFVGQQIEAGRNRVFSESK